MAMTIFYLLNGLAVVFMLYVLANFLKEGYRTRNAATKYPAKFFGSGVANVLVVTHPISHCACGGLSVTPMQAQGFGHSEEDYRRFTNELDEAPIEALVKSKRLSTR
jgi:hypothetical protein